MELFNLESFLPYLAQFHDKDVLSPGEASKLVLLITELLLDRKVDLTLLKFLSRFLTQQSYDEMVEERNIEHQCGYVTCDQSPTHKVRRRSLVNGVVSEKSTQFQIYNRKPSIILPNTYSSQYCCKEHYQASFFYRNQLSQESIFARNGIVSTPPFPENAPGWYENSITCLEEVLAKHRELKDQGKSLADVITMMSGLSVDDSSETSELIKLIQDFEIVEKEGGLFGDDDAVPEEPNAVEGYATHSKTFGGYVI